MPLLKPYKIAAFSFLAILFLSQIMCIAKKSKIEIANKNVSIELGKYLFFDRRLSSNNTRACGTCHNPQFAFTDGYKRSLGAFADLHQRNTQPLFNVDTKKYLTSADSNLHSVLQQMNNPLFNTHPIEMGVKGNETAILKKIEQDDLYKKLFAKAGLPISWNNIKIAIANFVNNIHSYRSPYDTYLQGDSNALNMNEKKGMQLFFSSKTNCSKCHGGKNFDTPTLINENGVTDFYFNTGLYNIDKNSSYPLYDQGLMEHTKNKNDMGKFRVPTLRNLAYTAPYLHDGSAASLEDILNIYENGGREIKEGVNKGNGRENIFKHTLIKGFSISENERKDLMAFLLSLSDAQFIKNSDYQNPFTEDETKK